jgi:ADP-ribose pyrophosphatase YjhB (NUDIX family)
MKRANAHKDDTGVVAVLRGNTVLLLRRGPTAPWMPGWWNLPGGVCENLFESIRFAASRELAEETGLELCGEDLTLFDRWTHPDGWRIFAYSVQAPFGWEPTLCEESDAYQWCSLDQLPRELVTPLPVLLSGLKSPH